MISQEKLAELYKEACETELQAFKPGNVSIYADGHDMTVNDFRISADVSAEPITNPAFSLGEKIFYSVKATRDKVGCNTNLGIILLCAPLIQATYTLTKQPNLRQALRLVLATTTVVDANWAYKAITLAAPGGLGQTAEQDVQNPATVTLKEAMAIAAFKDTIAQQYVSDYKDIFDFAVLRYNAELSQRKDKSWAAVSVYAELLSQYPDSHIERKHGKKYTDWIALRMQQFLEEFGQTTDLEPIKRSLYGLDAEFKSIGINPGTTADMTVATILTNLIEKFSARACSNQTKSS